jgi:hypothetical protein
MTSSSQEVHAGWNTSFVVSLVPTKVTSCHVTLFCNTFRRTHPVSLRCLGYHPPQYTTSNSYNDYDSSNRSGWSTLILLVRKSSTTNHLQQLTARFLVIDLQAIVVFVGYNVIKLCSRPINPTAGTAGDYAQYNNAGYNHNHNQGRHDGHWGNKGTGYTAPPAGNNGPGFWTGAGLGGLAGYAMGRNAA